MLFEKVYYLNASTVVTLPRCSSVYFSISRRGLILLDSYPIFQFKEGIWTIMIKFLGHMTVKYFVTMLYLTVLYSKHSKYYKVLCSEHLIEFFV